MFASFASCLCRVLWFLWEDLGLGSQTELVQNATSYGSLTTLHFHFLIGGGGGWYILQVDRVWEWDRIPGDMERGQTGVDALNLCVLWCFQY